MDLSRIIDPPQQQPQKIAPRPRVSVPEPRRRSRSPTPAPELPDDIDDYDRVDEVNDVDPSASSLSFIVAIEAKAEGRVVYCSESVTDILGYDQTDALSLPASQFAHPEDAPKLYQAYQEMIDEDKAACLLYIRIPFKDPRKGYALSSITASRVEEHIIGACSVASSSVKAMHNASTATDVFVISPTASHLEYMRWNMPPKQHSSPMSPTSSEHSDSRESSLEPPSPPKDTDDLETKMKKLTLIAGHSSPGSQRVAIVLERFSNQCPVLFGTNDYIIPRSLIRGRSFFDFVHPADEARVRKALELVKSWGVNERLEPSDGGFAFNRFRLCLGGRDSSARPDPAPLRNRRATHGDAPGAKPYRDSRPQSHRDGGASTNGTNSARETPERTSASLDGGSSSSRSKTPRAGIERGVGVSRKRDDMLVDAIFSPQSDGILVVLRPAKHTAPPTSLKSATRTSGDGRETPRPMTDTI